MRILFIDHTPFIGGAELALVRHIEYLDKTRFEPLVACSGTVPELVTKFKRAGAKVFVIPLGQLKIFSPAAVKRFVKALQTLSVCISATKPDLVVTNTERAMYVGTVAALLHRKKLIWWVRDFEYNRFLFRLLSIFPQKIICVSEAIRDYYSLGTSRKAEVVYVGSDFDQKLKQISFNDVLRVKEELGLSGAGLVVGFVGRLVEWKGPQVLIESIKGIKGIKTVIVGTGEGQEGNIEPELRQKIKEEGLGGTIILAGQRDDVPVLMKTFDVFCHTSIEPEPFATVVVEAMMAGIPVVGTSVGGTPEIISHGQTGFLVPSNDPKSLAAVLSYLASDQRLRRRIGEEGRRLALSKNTESVVTKQVERIYIGCLEDGCL